MSDRMAILLMAGGILFGVSSLGRLLAAEGEVLLPHYALRSSAADAGGKLDCSQSSDPTGANPCDVLIGAE